MILSVITLSLFGISSFGSLYESMEKKYKNESEFTLQERIISFESQFADIENMLEQFAESEVFINDDRSKDENILKLLKIYQNLSPGVSEVFYSSTGGEFYQGTDEPIPDGFNPVVRTWFNQAIMKQGEIVWTDPYLDYITQDIIVTAARSVSSPDRIEGVVGISFDLEHVSNQISHTKIGEDGFVMLLNRTGVMMANRDNHMIGDSLFGDQTNELLQRSAEDHIPYQIDGEDYLLRSESIRQDGMVIVTAISTKEILNKAILSYLPVIIGGMVFLLLFSLMVYLAALRAVHPLQRLGKLMGYVEKGDYNVQADVKDYTEVKTLSDGFNNMIKGIKKRDKELLISNNELRDTEERLRTKYEELKESQKILKESEEKILRLASHDSLTGLLNRRSLLEVLDKSFENRIYKGLSAVFFIDLDNFKTVNDSLGHTFGDRLIIEVAKKLTSLSHQDKQIARISGDEFIVVMQGLASKEEAESIAKEIKGLFEVPFSIEKKKLNITASIGVSLYPLHATSSEKLLQLADMAMYRAKNAGKNEYRIYDEGIKQELENKLAIELGIREALHNNQFELHYQPLYCTKTGRITSVEALLRTNSPALRNFNTFEIIQIAEITGQIVKIDKWVFKEACHVIQKINSQLAEPICISVNISAYQIMQQNFVSNITKIMQTTRVKPEWIKLEITESALMESFDINKEKLVELKKRGISFYLDDFGTGYSSLNYLNNLPIDRLKIDKSFVDVMFQSEKDRKMIETIILLAHNIGLDVVAEGVEDREQFDTLQNYKCEFIQGYFISRPVPYDEIVSVINQYES